MASTMLPMAGLADLVQRYQICWEVWPEYTVIGKRMQQVGFELELLGSAKDIEEFDPSCPKSATIHAALEAIARSVLESDERVSAQIEQNSQSLCYSPVRGSRADVTLSIKILHQTGFQNPVDESERNYLEKIKARLRQLRVCEHQWNGTTAGSGRVLAAV